MATEVRCACLFVCWRAACSCVFAWFACLHLLCWLWLLVLVYVGLANKLVKATNKGAKPACGVAGWLVGWLAAGCWLLLAAGCWLLLLLLLLPAAFCCC